MQTTSADNRPNHFRDYEYLNTGIAIFHLVAMVVFILKIFQVLVDSNISIINAVNLSSNGHKLTFLMPGYVVYLYGAPALSTQPLYALTTSANYCTSPLFLHSNEHCQVYGRVSTDVQTISAYVASFLFQPRMLVTPFRRTIVSRPLLILSRRLFAIGIA